MTKTPRPAPDPATAAAAQRSRAGERRPLRRAIASVTAVATVVAASVAVYTASAHAPAHSPTAIAANPAAAANPTNGYWTGTWASSPQSGGDTFSGQTIRQIVHTSISGTVARIQLSNAFGGGALTISDVHLAQAGSGSSIVAGTDHTVTFGGSTSVTIPAGGTGISDTISYAVPALTNLAISFYLPNNTGSSTFHQTSMQDTYVVGGDNSGAGSLSNYQTFGNYYFLSSLDVQNANSQGSVVALGASITDGVGTSQNGNDRSTDVLASRLNAAGDTVGVLNEGISGNRLLVDGSGQSALNRFNRDVLGQPGVRWVIFADDPINDLGSTSPQPTSAQLIAGLQQLIALAHQNGISFICATLTPYQGAGYWNSSGETAREAYDSYVRSSGNGCDGVVDIDNATHNPSSPTFYLPAYDSGDHLHPNNAGDQAIGNAVNLGLFKPPNVPVISLRAHANNDIVTADNAGASPLINNRTSIGPWEQFDEISEGNGAIALRAHANGLIVTAENAGAAPLIANRTVAQGWETFQLINNADGSVSLKASANGDYVTADTAGASPLIANSTTIGAAQEFDLVTGTGGPTPSPSTSPSASPSPSPSSSPGGINSAAWYEVINQNSGSCADDTNFGTTNGTVLQQWSCGGGTNQQWQFTPTSGGYYSVINRLAQPENLVWDVTGGPSATSPGTGVQLWSNGAGTNQQWLPVVGSSGYYTFQARNSGLCLAVPNSSTANGVQLVVNTCNGSSAQAFRLAQQP